MFRGICRHFLVDRCKRGSNCRFIHPKSDSSKSGEEKANVSSAKLEHVLSEVVFHPVNPGKYALEATIDRKKKNSAQGARAPVRLIRSRGPSSGSFKATFGCISTIPKFANNELQGGGFALKASKRILAELDSTTRLPSKAPCMLRSSLHLRPSVIVPDIAVCSSWSNLKAVGDIKMPFRKRLAARTLK